jgi:hypothetical protein
MAIALTDGFVLNVRMRHTVVVFGRIWLGGDYAIVLRMAIDQVAPIEMDLKRPEMNALQFDRFGRYRDGMPAAIELNFVELTLQRDQICIEIMNGSDWSIAGCRPQQALEFT